MRVYHQNPLRMTPQSKVSLEQATTQSKTSQNISMKKIQPTFEFEKLFDITPYTEILQQRRQLETKLVSHLYNDSTINTQSKYDSQAKQMLNGYASAQSKYTHDIQDFSEHPFRIRQKSAQSDCSCSFCQDRGVHHYKRQKANNSVQTKSPDHKIPEITEISFSRAKEDIKQTQSNTLSRRVTQKHDPPRNLTRYESAKSKERSNSQKIDGIQQMLESPIRRLDVVTKKQYHVGRLVHNFTQNTVKDKNNKTTQKERSRSQKLDDIKKQMEFPTEEIQQLQKEATQHQQQIKSALTVLKLIQKKLDIADKNFHQEVKSRFTQKSERVQSNDKQFVNEFPWRVDQKRSLIGQVKKKKLLDLYENHIKRFSRNDIEATKKKQVDPVIKQLSLEKERKKELLLKRQELFSQKSQARPSSEFDLRTKGRVSDYHKKKETQISKERERKASLQKALQKLKTESQEAISKVKQKKFQPLHDFIINDLDPLNHLLGTNSVLIPTTNRRKS